MSHHGDTLYLAHMLDTACKAYGRVNGLGPAGYYAGEDLRLALTYLMQTIGEAAMRVSAERGRRIPRSRGVRSLALATRSCTTTWMWART